MLPGVCGGDGEATWKLADYFYVTSDEKAGEVIL